jgi:predicted nucleotidyltransferase
MEYEKVNKNYILQNKLIEPEKKFLMDLKNYMELPIYIYGSLIRMDYFPNKSDIDIAIFTDNLENTVYRLIDFLGVSSKKVKIFKMKSTNKINYKSRTIWGFKTNYKLDVSDHSLKSHGLFYYPKNFKRFEILIYNVKNKSYIVNSIKTHFELSFFSSVFIYLLKLFYYYFFLNEKFYKHIKDYILEIPKKYKQEITIVGTL